jgi:deoxyribodipyrimidine photolyase-like uncharacterized protein
VTFGLVSSTLSAPSRRWDALYWRFVHRHACVLAANPRMAVMVHMKDKLGDKLKQHCQVADAYLDRIHA